MFFLVNKGGNIHLIDDSGKKDDFSRNPEKIVLFDSFHPRTFTLKTIRDNPMLILPFIMNRQHRKKN